MNDITAAAQAGERVSVDEAALLKLEREFCRLNEADNDPYWKAEQADLLFTLFDDLQAGSARIPALRAAMDEAKARALVSRLDRASHGLGGSFVADPDEMIIRNRQPLFEQRDALATAAQPARAVPDREAVALGIREVSYHNRLCAKETPGSDAAAMHYRAAERATDALLALIYSDAPADAGDLLAAQVKRAKPKAVRFARGERQGDEQ